MERKTRIVRSLGAIARAVALVLAAAIIGVWVVLAVAVSLPFALVLGVGWAGWVVLELLAGGGS